MKEGGDVAFDTTARRLIDIKNNRFYWRRKKNHTDEPSARWRRPTLLQSRNTQRHQKCEFHDHVQLIEFFDVRGQVNLQRPSGDLFPGIWNMDKMSPAIIGITSDSG